MTTLDQEPKTLEDEIDAIVEHPMPEQDRWRILKRLLRHKSAQIGGVVVLLLLIFTFFGEWIVPYDPFELDTPNRLMPPSTSHWLGTDEQGRDILSRIIYGSRYTMMVMFVTVTIGAIGGILLGLPSSYFGGTADMLVMRLVDVMLSFPYILLVLAIVAIIGPDLINAMIAIGVANMPGYARLARSSVLSVKEEEYVAAERALGASHLRIMFHTVLPNIISPLIVFMTLRMPVAVLSAAALSFLGLGAQPPLPEWGAMLVNARTFISTAVWVVWAPGMAIFITVLGINLFGNALRDVLDPRQSAVKQGG